MAKHKKMSPLFVLIIFILLPPLAWYFMWKDHRYHRWFAHALWLNGAIAIGLFLYFLASIYTNLTQPTITGIYVHIGLVTLGILDLILGIFLWKSEKERQVLSKTQLLLIIFLLFLGLIAAPIAQLVNLTGEPHL